MNNLKHHMSLYKKIGIWTYFILTLLSLLAGSVSELFIEAAVIGIFSTVLVFGVLAGFLNLSKNTIKEVSNLSLVLLLAGFLGTTLNSLPLLGYFTSGFMNALVAFNLPVVVITCLARVIKLASGRSSSKKKEIWKDE